MILDSIYRCHQDAIDIRERTEAIDTFSVWPGFKQPAPPRQQDNEGINPCGSSELNTRYSIRRTDLGPPFHDLMPKGMDLDVIVSSVTMSILVKWTDNCWAFRYRKTWWGLDTVSAL